MSAKRQKLIETAVRLFSEHGYHGTGIDWIADEAGVSKKTMYHYFRSKEEMIVAALRHHDSLFRNHFMASVKRAADTPYGRLLAIFDVAQAWFSQHSFFGCMFINAIGEYADRNAAISETCREFKRLMTAYIEELAQSVDVKDPHGLADALSILLEGSIVTAQVAGTVDSAATAKKAAKVLIDNALKEAATA